MTCDAIIQSNDTYDLIISLESVDRLTLPPDCEQPIDNNYSIFYYDRSRVPPLSIETYTYSAIPKCFGLLDTTALEESGILKLQVSPALSLYGQGVLIGFVDTGIAYENQCFRNLDGSTRIRAIWDQTAVPHEISASLEDFDQSDRINQPPPGFAYGVEYTEEQINEALMSENPRSIVPQEDAIGHGTALASIACGTADASSDFTGAAPLADILAVKLKPAKPYLKDFFYIPENAICYQENDIMTAIAYLEKKATEFGQPLVICIGLGTNNGSHSGGSILSEYLNDIGGRWRRCIVTASGNEAGARHHFMGKSDVSKGEPIAVEITAETAMRGFYLELWASAPELFTVSLRSPGGTLLPPAATRSRGHQEYEFLVENTTVTIDYRTVGRTRGDQLIFVRFDNAARGIWTLLVYPDTTTTGTFHVWLPMTGMLERDVYFLKPNPDVTLTIPSTAAIPITVGGYQTNNGGLYLNSGRGFTVTNVVKPDFVAPAVNIFAVNPRGNYTTVTGTSAACAITAGACAQIMEWGAVRRSYISLNSVEIGNILIRGCRRDLDRTYPNTQWGYGKLDVYEAFRNI